MSEEPRAVAGELERLAALRDAGTLTEAEFASAKARVLGNPAARAEPAVPPRPAIWPPPPANADALRKPPKTPFRKRHPLVMTGLIVAPIVGFGVLGAVWSDGSTTAGTESALACVNVVDALRAVANGTGSWSHAHEVAVHEEGRARVASDSNARYAPITEAIVEVESETDAFEAGPGAQRLIQECGPGAQGDE